MKFTPPKDPNAEIVDEVERFRSMILEPIADGSMKRQRGEKPPWWQDPTHKEALFSHYHNYLIGIKHDPDSGAHPLVHLAVRALMQAAIETFNTPASGWAEDFKNESVTPNNDSIINPTIETGNTPNGDKAAASKDAYGNTPIQF
jgi:hypothetical protein